MKGKFCAKWPSSYEHSKSSPLHHKVTRKLLIPFFQSPFTRKAIQFLRLLCCDVRMMENVTEICLTTSRTLSTLFCPPRLHKYLHSRHKLSHNTWTLEVCVLYISQFFRIKRLRVFTVARFPRHIPPDSEYDSFITFLAFASGVCETFSAEQYSAFKRHKFTCSATKTRGKAKRRKVLLARATPKTFAQHFFLFCITRRGKWENS